MAETFRISKKDGTKIVEGASPLAITGIAANTSMAAGDYYATRIINGVESPKVDIPAFKTLPIAVDSVKLDQTTLALEVGKTGTLKATVSPANATNPKVTFTSSDAKIATVDASGKVTAVAAGKVDITVTTEDGKKTAKCAVTVTAAP